ncbi:MAG: amino acid adenylation domain-containing protein [Aphanothece sp. CMT-3BRIN-NPC111]|jgi:amino acid adenylation domain-containing protein|nr:amino acid adenylation domain-containing protein [Aphanothece sp. CMT-3BRIN-NPC111]
MQNPTLEMQSEIIEGYRLSPQQKHLWLLQKIDNSLPYRVQSAILIEGNLNIDVFKNAVDKVINQHEILRTNFKTLPGVTIPFQVIEEKNLFRLVEHDISNYNFQEQETEIESIWNGFCQLHFDFEQNSPLHSSLITLSPQKHILIIALPALCADTVGINNLVGEISRSYAACLQGEELLDEPLQYADIAEWQNELLEAEDGETGRDYWRQQDFSGLLTGKLPWEKQLAKKKDFQPQVINLTIKPNLVEAIATLLEKHETSTSTFLLACWQTLLWRLIQQPDIIVGTAFEGRKYEELEPVIGLLAKYLPIHSYLKHNLQFVEVLQQVSNTITDAYQWQEYFTGEQNLVADNKEIELLSFPFAFEFEQQKVKYFANDVSFAVIKHYACIEQFKIKLSALQQDNHLKAEFYYDSNLFKAEDIQRLAEQFEKLLESVVKNPQAAISKLEILSDRERHQLLVEFNNTQADYPQDKCFHQLFEEQVARTPDNIAVAFENQQLTYTQLNERANQLAQYLQNRGIGTEVLVGICVERSLEMLVGILGILKAGGAYVPLDPTYPQERLAFMLEDAQAPVLLTQQRLLETLPQHNAKVVCLDTDWEFIQTLAKPAPTTQNSSNLAYVIYTSGSTGKPKGTLITHQGLVNYLSWCTKAYAVEQGEGAIVHSSIAFDATITGLFAPLLVGRKVQLLSEKLGMEALSSALQNSSNYSLVKITPAHLELLSQQLPPEKASGRTKAFIIGGENLVAETIAFWDKYTPETLLVNEYGPTETVVGCCIYQVPNGQHQSGSIPIGRPIANTQLYILDRDLQPVPIGVSGELYIGGAGVARGYLNRPELTAEKFIFNPFSNFPGARLYKTGDLARYLPTGDMEYLGRIDNQVKIRGFRIELGEIEEVLSQHPTVQKTVVVAQEDELSNKRLVAYVIPNLEQTTSISELQSFLKERLPEFMVPSAFVLLKELPLTSNGKVDRKALPTPEQVRPDLAATFVAPRNQTEEAIAQIWVEVLKLEQVGIHDNFFELGGHSLLLTQVTSRLQKAFQVEVSLRQIFETPTIAELAAIVAEKMVEQTDSEMLAQMLAELEELSEDEVQAVLTTEKQ